MNGDPWEQDFGDEDFVEGVDDEEEELGVDYTARQGGHHPIEDAPDSTSHAMVRPPPTVERAVRKRPRKSGGRKFRIRAMSARMAARSPSMASMLITRNDGSQVLIVRKGN